MLQAIFFDLFETLITESSTRPEGVSSLASGLGCERKAFRAQWRARRTDVISGRVPFRHALRDIARGLGGHAEEATLQRMSDERIRVKASAFAQVEHDVLTVLERLRSRGLRLGLISNCCAEDVVAWPQSPLASRFDDAVFSWEVGLAKPDPEIYRAAARRLRVDPADAFYIGDGMDQELLGAEQAGLRAFKAVWFLKRWPHFQEEPCSAASLTGIHDVLALVDRPIGSPPDDGAGLLRRTSEPRC